MSKSIEHYLNQLVMGLPAMSFDRASELIAIMVENFGEEGVRAHPQFSEYVEYFMENLSPQSKLLNAAALFTAGLIDGEMMESLLVDHAECGEYYDIGEFEPGQLVGLALFVIHIKENRGSPMFTHNQIDEMLVRRVANARSYINDAQVEYPESTALAEWYLPQVSGVQALFEANVSVLEERDDRLPKYAAAHKQLMNSLTEGLVD